MQITVVLKRTVPQVTNRVRMIKALRGATGYGLKESKDIADRIFGDHAADHTTFVHNIYDVSVWLDAVNNFNSECDEAQIVCTSEISYYRPMLEEIVLTASLRGDLYMQTAIQKLLDIAKLEDELKAEDDA